MFKSVITTVAVLVCLTGPQAPVKANVCPLGDMNCWNQQQRMDEIERRQREIIERQECLRYNNSIYC